MAPAHKRKRIPETKEDFFANLPLEIMIEIISRLPIPTVMRFKHVCRSWLNLIESFEFAKSHVSISVRGLALDEDRLLILAMHGSKESSKPHKILEIVDSRKSGRRYNVVFQFNFPHSELLLHSSADGLLLLLNKVILDLYICNPITREYVKLPPLSGPPPPVEVSSFHKAFGFGVSKLTSKYKVVRMSHEDGQVLGEPSPCKFEVYTLGTGSWRSVAAHGDPLLYSFMSPSVFLNGNLHWLVRESKQGDSVQRIAYFDLENECFGTFSFPHQGPLACSVTSLCALGDSLCLCDNIPGYVVNIWLMNKYGDEKSWRKEIVIEKYLYRGLRYLLEPIVPIKMFRNGDTLFANEPHPKLYWNSGCIKEQYVKLMVY